MDNYTAIGAGVLLLLIGLTVYALLYKKGARTRPSGATPGAAGTVTVSWRKQCTTWLGKHWKGLAIFFLFLPFIWWGVKHGAWLWVQMWNLGTPFPVAQAPRYELLTKRINKSPLQWNMDARVKERPQIVEEKVTNGLAFAGVMSPGTWEDKIFSATDNKTGWSAYLTDWTSNEGGIKPELLSFRATTKKDVAVGILELRDLSSYKGEETQFLRNDTGSPDNPPVICEHYLQVTGNSPCKIGIKTLKRKPGIFEYELEVGGRETTIILPNDWKYFWMVPVHHPGYQSQLLHTTVPSQGLSYQDAKTALQSSLQNAQILGEGYRQDWSFQSILTEQNGETSILEKAMLFRPVDMRSDRITVRLNIPTDKDFATVVTPAKILIGIQTR